MQQQPLDFEASEAVRLQRHLQRCGLPRVQARLVGLVLAEGCRRAGGEDVRYLTISSRQAAALVGASDRAVAKAAATLAAREWFWIVPAVSACKPPTYVVDVLAARSLSCDPLNDWEPPDATGVPDPHLVGCEPLRTTANQVRTSPRVLPERDYTNPVSSSHLPLGGAGGARPPVRSSSQQCAVEPARRWPLPWSRLSGVSDAELVAAVRINDHAVLRYLFDVATGLEWIMPGSDAQWFDFLVAAHHAATARLARRMGRLVAFVRSGLDVAKCAQASDRWAAQMLQQPHRDPQLARRLCDVGRE